MAINIYLSTLNCNGLNAAVKRHMVAEWKQNEALTYAIYMRLTLDWKTHTDGKLKGGKRYFTKMETNKQKKLSGNTYTRQKETLKQRLWQETNKDPVTQLWVFIWRNPKH